MTDRQLYGDVQTPSPTAEVVSNWVAAQGLRPATVVEPTCGTGAFLAASRRAFPDAALYGFELNPVHLDAARRRDTGASLARVDAFEHDWSATFATMRAPRLILGNPPWTTTAVQGVLGAQNRPRGRNPTGLRGLDAVIGRSNFDVSEWLVQAWMAALCPGDELALIIKRSVARRLLASWPNRAAMTLVDLDARRIFNAAVDAVLFHAAVGATGLYHSNSLDSSSRTEWQLRDSHVVRDPGAFNAARRWMAGLGGWRSGVKHDCKRVFELERAGEGFRSGVETFVELESEWVVPLLKSSDLHHGRSSTRYLLITPPDLDSSPLVRDYLERHRTELERRKSRIYRRRSFCAQFGIGPYTFAPERVAVSGLHWPPRFRAFKQPMVFDDTCYLLPCEDAGATAERLNRPEVRAGLAAVADVGGKRPITQRILELLTR
ncbi:MAG: class I SAM-dependent methyltransferase [Myxococcota bacterium]